MNPERFFELVQAGEEVTPTDKNYKAYVSGTKKLYFQHFTEKDRQDFIRLLNEKSIRLAYPGHFYRLPFFITMAETTAATE